MKVEIYSDVACPWCYIGYARFQRSLTGLEGADDVEVVYRPYQLDPGAPRKAEPMLDYLERRFGPGARDMANQVAESARGEGLPMDFERGLTGNTLDAHRLMRLAELEYGAEAQRKLATALFEAQFADGRDIGDAETLAELAAGVGIDAGRASTYLASDEGEREVREEIERAQRIGVTAVPTFVFEGRYAVQGAQPPATFREVLEAVALKAEE
jgi:predicted DsbA family dithiol-disulfide isomerase